MLPKVKLKVAKVEEYFEILEYFFLGENIFGVDYAAQFSGLKEILSKSKDKRKSLFDYFKNLEDNNRKELQEKTKRN